MTHGRVLPAGATSAPCLIFIFPAIFYIRIVPVEDEPMNSRPKILVRLTLAEPTNHFNCWLIWRSKDNMSETFCSDYRHFQTISLVLFFFLTLFLFSPPGGLFCCSGLFLHGNESQLHNNRLDNRGRSICRRPLDAAWVCGQCWRKHYNLGGVTVQCCPPNPPPPTLPGVNIYS